MRRDDFTAAGGISEMGGCMGCMRRRRPEGARGGEERRAVPEACTTENVEILRFRDGFFPYEGARIKEPEAQAFCHRLSKPRGIRKYNGCLLIEVSVLPGQDHLRDWGTYFTFLLS